MNNNAPSYHGYRFPPEIISHAVWLYHRLCLSPSDKCEGSSQQLERNVSFPHTEPSRIFSESDGICCGQSTSAYCEPAPSFFGMK